MEGCPKLSAQCPALGVVLSLPRQLKAPVYLLVRCLARCDAHDTFQQSVPRPVLRPVLPLVLSLEELRVAPDCWQVHLLGKVQQAGQVRVVPEGLTALTGVRDKGAAVYAAADARCVPADITQSICIAVCQAGSDCLAKQRICRYMHNLRRYAQHEAKLSVVLQLLCMACGKAGRQ